MTEATFRALPHHGDETYDTPARSEIGVAARVTANCPPRITPHESPGQLPPSACCSESLSSRGAAAVTPAKAASGGAVNAPRECRCCRELRTRDRVGASAVEYSELGVLRSPPSRPQRMCPPGVNFATHRAVVAADRQRHRVHAFVVTAPVDGSRMAMEQQVQRESVPECGALLIEAERSSCPDVGLALHSTGAPDLCDYTRLPPRAPRRVGAVRGAHPEGPSQPAPPRAPRPARDAVPPPRRALIGSPSCAAAHPRWSRGC